MSDTPRAEKRCGIHAQLIVFDIDGTLVDPENPISDRTVNALREVQKQGLQIAFASSRPVASLKLFAERINVAAHLIAFNGALVVCVSGRQLAAEGFVMDRCLTEVLHKFCESGGCVNVYRRSYWLAIGPSAAIDLEERATGLTADSRSSPEALARLAGRPVLKVMCHGSRSACKQLLGEVDELPYLTGLASRGDCCDIQAKGVDKARAVRELCQSLDIAPGGVVAFGDSDSDASMLRMVGYGVAVGAASVRAKMAAREHIDGPGSEAVAEWLGRMTMSG